MRIISNKALQSFADLHPQATVALQEWRGKIRGATVKSYADLKTIFNSVDKVGDYFVFIETLSPVSSDVLNYYTTLCESIPLYPLHTEQDYDKAIVILNALLDAGGADENHPLARLVEALGIFIGDYESHHAFL